MSTCSIVIEEGTPLDEVAYYMLHSGLFQITVVDKEKHPVGTVTRTDVLRSWMGGSGWTDEAL